ncbi:MAG: hypothetical protein M3P12_01615 [Gemmatimonadota bacterium]|nr:hypothetical protein [Gemmatimonadota bacterium]
MERRPMVNQTPWLARITRVPNITVIHTMGTRHAVAAAQVSVDGRVRLWVSLHERLCGNLRVQ